MSARILANSQRSITCFHAGWRAGLVPASLLAFAALSILAGGLARADPVGQGCVPVASAVSAGDIVLASLGAGEAVSAASITGRRIVPDFDGTVDATIKVRPIIVSGRCGSSQYRCDSPGFTYCCGNSTDGFYCAADVNGCTK